VVREARRRLGVQRDLIGRKGLSMLVVIVLLLIAIIPFVLSIPGRRFVDGFAALLVDPVISRRTLWSYVCGVDHVGGEFENRPVVLVLNQRRNADTLGYLIVALKSTRSAQRSLLTAATLREWLNEPDAREALDQLELHDELKVTFEDGWLKSTWMPFGFFIFPGRFDDMRWRNVLRAMQNVLVSFERSAASAPPPG